MIQSKRLQAIYNLLPKMDVVIDVGCDHGYLEELLLKNGKVKKVIATDISSKSLEKTRARMCKLGLIEDVELICADGLNFKSQSKSNFAIIAGIGGVETINIIEENKENKNIKEFILIPVQNAVYVREYLIQKGYHFVCDKTIFEKGKFYSIIHCRLSGTTNHQNKYFGKTDLEEMGDDFKRFVLRELNNLQFLDSDIGENENLSKKREYREMLLKLKGE